MIRVKYLKGRSIFKYKMGKKVSFVWKGICWARQLLCKAACFKTGDRLSINIWKDHWVPNFPNFIPVVREGRDWNRLFRVAELKNLDGNGWNEQLVRDMFEPSSADAILSIEWPKDRCVDKLVWLGNKGEGFSVGSSYKSLFGVVLGSVEMSKSDRLWKRKIHDRLKLFLWRILAQVILTRDLTNKWFGLRKVYYPSCGAETKTYMHLFKDCPTIRALAFASKWGYCLNNLIVSSLEDWMELCITLPGKSKQEKRFTQIFLATLFYCSWEL